MNILYECVAGKAPASFLGALLIAIGAACLIAEIACIIDTFEFNVRDFFIVVVCCLFIIGGTYALHDGRYKQVYATVNEDASWKDINNDYTLLEQKGELYIFRVNDEKAAENER